MSAFIIRFLFNNIFISGIIIIFLITKQFLKNKVTSRIQYNLWFPLLALLAVPFIPFKPVSLSEIFLWLIKLTASSAQTVNDINLSNTSEKISTSADWINDFSLSVSRETPSTAGIIFCCIWFIGIFGMILLIAKSKSRLNTLKKSALPLQNRKVRRLYESCLTELRITKNIPIYSTAFLKSPIMVGLVKPCIYLPIHLISDFRASDMRYMLLHELQHYKHKDAFANYFMNLAGVLYWFNPFVWYSLKKMKSDREVACDASVLALLDEKAYGDYGNTLINFAEKVSLNPFPFATGLSGNMTQMKQRILNISSYQKPSVWKKITGITVLGITSAAFFILAPILSTYAAEQNHYKWNISSENISISDLSTYFNGYEGSFVLFDQKNNSWNIYDMEHATLRTSPNSTYKIYTALFGLEESIITPNDSVIAWNGTDYPFQAWNTDQDLYSAMHSSVNWYFQEIDKQLGASAIKNYIEKIGYGNKNIDSNLSSYWMESTLKISPIEQVELLTDLYNNNFGFTPENVNTVKDSICLFSSQNKSFYGKTGTGRIDGQDLNGWFVGFVETAGNTYFFATNIQNDTNATGSKATEITKSILSNLGIWE